MSSNFDFESQRKQSHIKTTIVTKYFDAWTNVMKGQHSKLGYIDLYAGPGIYFDGTESTPIIILKKILGSTELREKCVTYFNEKDEDLYNQLKTNIESLEEINELKYKPIIVNKEVNDETAEMFGEKSLIPSFTFIDPAGYAGLSIDLIRSVGKDRGSDLLFFFNYNDVNRGLNNPKVKTHMEKLFGKNNYDKMMELIKEHPNERENLIINEMSCAINKCGMKYVLPFRFKFEKKERTSHYLIFSTKNLLGYKIMKDIMSNAGEKDMYGVGQFEFIPSSDKEIQMKFIDSFNSSLEDLKIHLLEKYSGKELLVEDIVYEDFVNNRYVLKDYKNVLIELEEAGKIKCYPTREERPKRKGKTTLNEKKVKVCFYNGI